MLLTAGVQLAYVAKQMGHADVSVTAKHYAHWSGDEESEPLRRESGEVRADLIARRGRESDFVTSVVTSPRTTETADRLTAREVERKLVELGGIEPPTLRLPERVGRSLSR